MADVTSTQEDQSRTSANDGSAWDTAKSVWNKELFSIGGMKVDVGDIALTVATVTPIGAALRLGQGALWAGRLMGFGSKAATAAKVGAADAWAGAQAVKGAVSAAADSKVATTAGSTLRSMFMAPVKGQTSAGTYGNLTHKADGLLHKAGDTVYGFSKTRTALTGVGALALDGTVTDGAIGRTALGAAGLVVNGVTKIGGAAADGAGKLAESTDDKVTGGEGKKLLNQATDAVTGGAAPAGTAAGAEETVLEQDEQGNTVRVPRSQSKESTMKNMLSGLMEKAKNDPAMALGVAIGGMVGMSKSNGMMEAAWKVPLYAAMFGMMFKILGPIVMPLLGAAGSALQQSFAGASVGTNQSAVPAGLQQAPAGPVADKTVKSANESEFQQNARDVTGIKLVDGDTRIDLRNRPPAMNGSQFALHA